MLSLFQLFKYHTLFIFYLYLSLEKQYCGYERVFLHQKSVKLCSLTWLTWLVTKWEPDVLRLRSWFDFFAWFNAKRSLSFYLHSCYFRAQESYDDRTRIVARFCSTGTEAHTTWRCIKCYEPAAIQLTRDTQPTTRFDHRDILNVIAARQTR